MSATRGEHESLFVGSVNNGLSPLITAAHELKSPLALIRQLSIMLENNEVSDADRERMLRQISLTSERALRLTSDLTRSARLQDALFTMEPINPYQLCKGVVHELTPLFAAHNREIKLTSCRNPMLLIANRDLLRRIIINFSDNALHYSEGNIATEIRIGTIGAGSVIRLGVRDYGPALLANTLDSLRNKMICNAPTAVHARPQSSGLGLYIAGQFADAMNGHIGITRHRDGATFYVDLQASRQLSLL